jgi:hypothetical protein
LTFDKISATAWAVYHPVHGVLGLVVLTIRQRPQTVERQYWVYRGTDPAPTGRPAASKREAGERLRYWWERIRLQPTKPAVVRARPVQREVAAITENVTVLRRQLEQLAASLEIEPTDSLTRQVV